MSVSDKQNWRVEFYATASGKSPVLGFLATLPAAERAVVRRTIELLIEFGVLLRGPHARPIKGHRKLWELRAGPNRLFYFAHVGRTFIILHGFRKKSRKTPRKEIATAERYLREFLERVGE